jgi:uncharacterized membrane protein HdeD (DUF308 family)
MEKSTMNQEKKLVTILANHWWVLLVRGLLAIAFGVFSWIQPGISLASLIILFGAYALSDGIFGVWTAIKGREHHEHWWVLLIEGLIGIAAGLMTFFAPGVTTLVLLIFIATWAVARGVLEIVAAIRLRKEIEGEWLYVLGGLVSILFGGFLITHPGEGALALLWVVGFYAVSIGLLLVLLAFRVRTFGKGLEA